MENSLSNTHIGKRNRARSVFKSVVNALFRVILLLSYLLLIATFLAAVPIWVIGWILWQENSDLFSYIIYNRWFEPIQTKLWEGI